MQNISGEDAKGKAQDILGGFSEAPPFPDVGPALKQLHTAGIKVPISWLTHDCFGKTCMSIVAAL